jgi:hypothetical protein
MLRIVNKTSNYTRLHLDLCQQMSLIAVEQDIKFIALYEPVNMICLHSMTTELRFFVASYFYLAF